MSDAPAPGAEQRPDDDEVSVVAYPNGPFVVRGNFRITGPDGQSADATVTISVRERDAATNVPPVPQTVTARVVAGQSVRVTVPLNGIDPDGDSVQLVGVAERAHEHRAAPLLGQSRHLGQDVAQPRGEHHGEFFADESHR